MTAPAPPNDDTPLDADSATEATTETATPKERKRRARTNSAAARVTGSQTKSSKTAQRLGQLRSRIFRPQTLFATASLVMFVVFAPRLIRKLPDLKQQEQYRLQVAAVQITPPPPWVPHDLVKQIGEQQDWLESPPSILDEELVAQTAQAFAAHPWVLNVVSVRKEAPHGLRVELQYRRPVALVEVAAGQFYPIDAASVLLPPADFSRADLERYPRITGCQSLPQGPAGRAWGDIAITGAAQLAAQLQRLPDDQQRTWWEQFDLTAIECPRRTTAEIEADDIGYTLVTRDGSRILWGRAPGTQHPGELTAEQKLGRLTQYLADYGRFGHAAAPLEIDIRHWQEITQRLLSTRR